MSATTGATSTPLERDAQQINARPHDKIDAGEIAIGVVIGRASEFFDFFVFAIASVIVFPQLVFPFAGPLLGTLYSFALFALAFIARPLGTWIFIAVDRYFGRGTKLTIALLLLGTSTVATAFLPGYETIGIWSVVLLALLRIGQGIALGGTWEGLASLLAMNAPAGKRGWYAMLGQIGAPIGLILASALFAFFVSLLSTADFLDWGWRYPFFVAFAINVVALFARLRISATPAFIESYEDRELQPSPVRQTVRAEGWNIVIGAFAPLASFALFHMVTVFPLSWVLLYTKEPPARFLIIELVGAFVCLGCVILSGPLADRYGRRNLLAATAAAIAAFSGFAPQMLAGGEIGGIVFMMSGFILLGLSFGQSSGSLAANFAAANRYTSSALTSDLAWLFGAGFAPLAALLLASNFGLGAAGVYLLSGAGGTLIALWINRETTHARKDARAG
jgi:MFS family permease